MMKALILKSEFSEADVREILGVCQAIESRKQKPVWYSLLITGMREAQDHATDAEASFQPLIERQRQTTAPPIVSPDIA